MRRRTLGALLAAGMLSTLPGMAGPPVPMHEIVETVRDLAAAQLGRKPSEIDTIQSLFAQGLNENGLAELVSAIQIEFGVVIPDSEIHQGKWNDAVRGFSVRRLADLVAAHLRPE